jgi:hypothetical protein
VYFSDDLWALYYMSCENINGALPWRKVENRDTINNMKHEIYEEKYLKRDSGHPWFDDAIEPDSLFEMRQDLVKDTANLTKYSRYKEMMVSELHAMEDGRENMKLDWELKVEC